MADSPIDHIKKEAEKLRAAGIAKLIKKAAGGPDDLPHLSFAWPAGISKPKVPPGYGLKGGWARFGLAKALSSRFFDLHPRDTDLVLFLERSSKERKKVSKKIMAEDASHGHYAEKVDDLYTYFASRDFSINQVVVRGRTIYATSEAVADLQSGAVRAVKAVDHSTAIRGIRLLAEAGSVEESGQFLESVHGMEIPSRLIELNLERAAERGVEAGQRMEDLLAKASIVPVD